MMHFPVQTALGIVHPLLVHPRFHVSDSSLCLVALSNIWALLDALALAAAGVGVLERLALLVLALREVSGLVGAVNAVRLRRWSVGCLHHDTMDR